MHFSVLNGALLGMGKGHSGIHEIVQGTHYNDVIMGTIASQITSLTIVYSTVYSGADQGKHQSPASLAFVRGIHRTPVNSPHKWSVTRKMFPLDDVIMNSCFQWLTRPTILSLWAWSSPRPLAASIWTIHPFALVGNTKAHHPPALSQWWTVPVMHMDAMSTYTFLARIIYTYVRSKFMEQVRFLTH